MPTLAVAHLAEAHGSWIAPHQSGGPVATAVCLQLAACVPNFLIQENFDYFNDPWTRELVTWTPGARSANGHFSLPTAPGLGLKLNLDVARDHPYDPKAYLNVFAEGWEKRLGTTTAPTPARAGRIKPPCPPFKTSLRFNPANGRRDGITGQTPPSPRIRKMKLTRIETIRSPDFPNLLWVHLHTDDGLVGLGETFYIPAAVEAVIHDFAAPLLLGQSAFDRERHWQALFSYANFFGHAGAEMRAISALDIALWDLLGQHTGQPVLNLLGGQTRDSIRIYNTCVDTPKYADQTGFLEKPGDLARSLLAQGITAMKVWPWDRFAPQMKVSAVTGPAGWSAVGPVGHDLLPGAARAGPVDGAGNPPRRGRQDADRARGPLALGRELRAAHRPRARALRRDVDGGFSPARQRAPISRGSCASPACRRR